MGALNLVYFVRPYQRPPHLADRASAELRYSMRSVAANLRNLGEVHVFGGSPHWLSHEVISHPVRQGSGKHENTWKLWREIAAAGAAGELPETFAIMNDDFFLMRPADDIVPTYSGTIAEWTAARQFSGAETTALAMQRTVDILRRQPGWAAADPAQMNAYELHMPLPVATAEFVEIVAWLAPHVAELGRIAKRSAYGNMADPSWRGRGRRVERDVKVREGVDPVPDSDWLSTSDEAFWYSAGKRVGGVIRSAFATPCRFEVETV